MAKILSRVLRTLGDLYSFPDSRFAPTAIELELPVQLVHDVRSDAVMGAANGSHFGYWIAQTTQSHVGGGSITDTLTLSAPGEAGNGFSFNPEQEWAWVMDSWVAAGSNFTEAAIRSIGTSAATWQGPTDGIAGPPDNQLLFVYEGKEGANFADGKLTHTCRRPSLLMSDDPALQMQSVHSGIGTTTQFVTLWIGPIGVLPGFLGS